MLTKSDIQQIESKGIAEEQIISQLNSFRHGFPFMNITAPATVGHGIIKLENDEVDDLVDIYKAFEGRRVKFIPASGAATRMFKHLFEFQEEYPVKGDACFKDKSFGSIYRFFESIKNFAFYGKLYNELWSIGYKMDELLAKRDFLPIINTLLGPEGLNYGSLPKGLIQFHRYGDIARTSLEEHLVEGAQYCRDPHGNVFIHLTVSPEHREAFAAQVDMVKTFYESHYDIILHVSYSVQKPSTDTIAVDMGNEPFRNPDGSLLFRPGGHGALIENLNDIDAEIVFIKNIDNVVPDRLKPQTVRYKKALAGLLISYRNIIFEYIQKLIANPKDEELLNTVLDFAREELCVLPPAKLNTGNSKQLREYLLGILNRPIRVCGMVKNQGEPGGGPFWAVNPDGSTSLQIVESSQIDLNDPSTKSIFDQATHFNPVDLVCYVRDFEGKKFNLLSYCDPQTGFISVKSKDGKKLKALELPGLWNGAMSNWNTIFVEVPLITFNPVKTVNDLLREEHQSC
jgi:hypothetical protein